MTIKSIVKELAKREGLKKQIDIAQLSELVGHLSDMFYENYADKGVNIKDVIEAKAFIDSALVANGVKRAKKKAKKVRGA